MIRIDFSNDEGVEHYILLPEKWEAQIVKELRLKGYRVFN